MRRLNKGFTLIELLVVISIIGLLSSVVLASLNGARDKGKVAGGLTFADHNYHFLGANALFIYNFNNDISAGTTLDASGNNLNGTVVGAPALPVNGGPTGSGKALFLDRVNNRYITLTGLSNYFSGISGFTVGIWINPADLTEGPNGAGLFTLLQGIQPCYFVIYNGKLAISVPTPVQSFPGSGNSFNTNQWQYVSISYKSGVYTGYINGVSIGTINDATFDFTLVSNIKIGTEVNAAGRFNGYMDDAALYMSALSDSQIKSLYAEGLKNHPLANNK